MAQNSIWRFVLDNAKLFKYTILIQIIVAFAWSIDTSVRPYIFKKIVDSVQFYDGNFEDITFFCSIYICMAIVMVALYRIWDLTIVYFNSPLKRHIIDVLTKKTLLHSHSFFNNNFAGAISNKIKDVGSSTPDLIQLLIERMLAHFLGIVFSVIVISKAGIEFAIYLALWIIIFFLGSMVLSKSARDLSHIASESRSKITGLLVDIFSNISSIRLFSNRLFEATNFRKHLDLWGIDDRKRDLCFIKIFIFQGLSFLIYQSISIYFIIQKFKTGGITAGDFVLIFTINNHVIDVLWSLSTDVSKVVEYHGNISQGLSVVLTPLEIVDKKGAKDLNIKNPSILFDKVSFHYKGAIGLFYNKSVEILSYQKVGLVGYSGSGKSSFVNLILRMYDINSGKILIDGQNIANCTQESLRRNISTIPQEPMLFHRTLMENIRYGKLDATDTEVMEAAEKACAHEFIIELPDGYDSLVGERGVKLSGGQRQRIAIARAILQNAPILILDEATSQLDSITEKNIQSSLVSLMHKKTTIVIAHRLSTLLNMDRILVFDKGQIVQDGTHEELLRSDGLYKYLWNTQVDGVLRDSPIEE